MKRAGVSLSISFDMPFISKEQVCEKLDYLIEDIERLVSDTEYRSIPGVYYKNVAGCLEEIDFLPEGGVNNGSSENITKG